MTLSKALFVKILFIIKLTIILLVALASATMAISSHIQKKLKKIKIILLMLVSNIKYIGNSNYLKFEDIISSF